jgi:hypothetical protein
MLPFGLAQLGSLLPRYMARERDGWKPRGRWFESNTQTEPEGLVKEPGPRLIDDLSR